MTSDSQRPVKWRYAFASAVGTSHVKLGTECQDTSLCNVLQLRDGKELIVAVVADGAGRAQKAGLGSTIAATALVETITEVFSTGGQIEDISREFVLKLVNGFQNALTSIAEGEHSDVKQFATTLLAAIVGPDSAVFFQIGDGAIVFSKREQPDEYAWAFWPQQGQYVNQTFFLTDEDAAEKIEYKFVTEPIDELALFTDGLQVIALHFQTQTAHAPFFRAMFKPLYGAASGYLKDLSNSLATYLDSAAVNQRTDDDKSLILAGRRSV
jgi:hypothetical protein